MKYYLYRDSQNEWRWTLRASNNQVIADSGEGYSNRDNCLKGIALVKQSSNAQIVYV